MIDDFFYSIVMHIEETARTLHKVWSVVRLLILSSNIGWLYKQFEEKLAETVEILENMLKTVFYLYTEYA